MSTEGSDDLLYQFIREALLSKAAGLSTKLYDQLLSEVRRLKSCILGTGLAQDPTVVDQFVALISSLTRCISSVHERKHEVLLTELYDLPMWRTPAPARHALLDFITHGVVAHGALVQTSLHTLVYSLMPPPGPQQPDTCPGEAWKPIPEQIMVQDDIILATEKVLELVPTSAPRVLPLLVSNLPHKLRPRNCHCLYLRGLFKLAEGPYGHGLREGILAAVVDHLIAVDVEIKWEDIAEATVAEEEAKEEEGGEAPKHPMDQEPDIFELEGMSELDLINAGGGFESHCRQTKSPTPGRGGWEGSHARALPAVPLSSTGAAVAANGNAAIALPAVDETADKLDSMMELTIAHLDRRIAAGQLVYTWATVLDCFERTVLHTHRSKFTQFIVFHLARKAPEDCCRSLLGLLLTKVGDKQQPAITRSAAAAYTASFLARAAYVPNTLTVESLQRLLDWCLRYAKEEDARGGLAPIPSSTSLGSLVGDAQARHAAFYAACQALLYVLCYHMEPLLKLRSSPLDGPTSPRTDASKGLGAVHVEMQHNAAACAEAIKTLASQDLPLLLGHSLDPLGSCAPSVIAEFGRQAGVFGFPNLARFIKEWQRNRAMSGAKQMRPLEVFFPFDPYLLRRSAAVLELESAYVHWRRGHALVSGIPADVADSDDEGEGMSDDEESSSDSESDSEDSSSSSDDDSDSSSENEDDMKRTRFGSMPSVPGSSMSDGSYKPGAFVNGRGGRGHKRGRLPGALHSSIIHGGALGGSPTMGIAVPGSLSTDNTGGSPWGMSPIGNGMGSFVPMSLGR